MLSNSSQKLSLSIAKKILIGFEYHYQNIKSASIEAKRCFEEREWQKIEDDSKLRLNFYDEQVDYFCKKLSLELLSILNSKVDNSIKISVKSKFKEKGIIKLLHKLKNKIIN